MPRVLALVKARVAAWLLAHVLQDGGPFERLEMALRRVPAALQRSRFMRPTPARAAVASHATTPRRGPFQRVYAALHHMAQQHHAQRHPTTAPANQRMHESLSLVDHLGLLITQGVGTMACAALFMALALVSLPNVVRSHDPVTIVGWVAQTFLQLVLLAILQLGQNLGGRHQELRAEADYETNVQAASDIKAVLSQLAVAQEHLARQDAQILALVEQLGAIHLQVVTKAAARDAKRPPAKADVVGWPHQ